MKQQIRQYILRILHAADGEPMRESAVKQAVRTAYPNVAFTESDLGGHLRWLEEQKLIIGAHDELTGTDWTLTPKGGLKAAQLG